MKRAKQTNVELRLAIELIAQSLSARGKQRAALIRAAHLTLADCVEQTKGLSQ